MIVYIFNIYNSKETIYYVTHAYNAQVPYFRF